MWRIVIKYLLFTVINSGGPQRRSRDNKTGLLTRLEGRSVIGQNTDVTVAVAKLEGLPDQVRGYEIIAGISFIYSSFIIILLLFIDFFTFINSIC